MFTDWAVKVGDHLALIDSGTGGHPIYGQGNGKLLQSMVAAGLEPKAIKTILLTHPHGDHIYGLMRRCFPTPRSLFPPRNCNGGHVRGSNRSISDRRAKAALSAFRPRLPRGKTSGPLTVNHNFCLACASFGRPDIVPHVTYLIASGGKQFLISSDVAVLALQISTNPEW
jgi:glyoxylase-like metal-dependent hydrolase (beta-lactamase superfamily II)